MQSHRKQFFRHQRRGAIYVVVLLSSLIVASIGLASLQLMRLQSRTASSSSDFVEARTFARAALDIGMLKIRNDPFWRTNLGNGNWITNQSIGGGKYSLSAVDPIDGNVTVGDNHPIILTGIGMKGDACFKTSMRMEVGPRTKSCLEVSMISGQDLSVSSATLTSDQKVSANNRVSAGGGSTVNADVEAFDTIGGSTYTKTTLPNSAKRIMPDPVRALDYYLANGTTIQYTALSQWGEVELITNGRFETDILGWYANTTCVFQHSTTQAREGVYSLKVKNRATGADVAAQDLQVGVLKSGNKYHLSVPIFPSGVMTGKGTLTLTSTGEGVQVFETPVFNFAKDGSGAYTWVDLNADITPTWTGTLTKATVSIWTSVNKDYYMDKVSLIDVTYPKGYYVIDKCLLSPTVNPFGATNTLGIYVINCSGKDIVIGRSRIVGTVVFVNPGSGTLIQNSVCWEAAVYNYPAVLTDKKFSINLGSAGLSEAGLGVNLNPPGTPYPIVGGTSNTTTTESYPSRITGIIYSKDSLTFLGTSNITGVVVANNDINVDSASLSLSYGNVYLNTPPPGFEVGTITMKVVPGTWKRTVE